MSLLLRSLLLLIFIGFAGFASAKPRLEEIRTASDRVLVLVFRGVQEAPADYTQWINTKIDVEAVHTDDRSGWKINGQPPLAMHKFVTESSGLCVNPKGAEYYIYLEIPLLVSGTRYTIETPLGDTAFVFNDRAIFCESVKTNQTGYSALSNVRYANVAVWLGTGGSRTIEGALPAYEVFEPATGKTVVKGRLTEMGKDESSGDFVYRADLSKVPEGGPYKISVKGYGCSYPFGVGGNFSRRLGYVSFRSLFYQRCGIALTKPYAWEDIRLNPCHTVLYNVNAATGEANLNVVGTEPSFTCYGGYHDAGDADRRLYHLTRVPHVLMTTYEAFPGYFTDKQFNIPDKFDANFSILGQGNGIPDIIDEAEWAALIWEYLQEPDGGVHWGTETRGYPEPFYIPMDQDRKKYGTIRVDNSATTMAAAVFMHLARLLKPYKPDRTQALQQRAERAMAYVGNKATEEYAFYYAVQKYLLTGDSVSHQRVKAFAKKLAIGNPYLSGKDISDRVAFIGFFYPYLLAKERSVDPETVRLMKTFLRNTADSQMEIFAAFAYPVGNPLTSRRQWGSNVIQGMHAYPCLLQWNLTQEQKYIDVACQLMDYTQGLNPPGKCYVTGMGFNRVANPHDCESEYTKTKGWGVKPGILIYGPGNLPDKIEFTSLPHVTALPRERQWVDHLYTYGMTEFTVHETLIYPAVIYPVLARGGTWTEGRDPFE